MSERIGVGDAFPDIAMTAPDGGVVKPSDFAGRKLVVFFYPKDDTPGCTTENKDFSALADQFAAAGVALLGVSKDPPKKHQKFAEKHALVAPLASDAEEGGLSDALGIWTEKSMYGRTYMGIERATFLVGPDGNIVRAWRNVRVPGHAEAVQITYDPKVISYGKLLQIFFSVAHNPTELNRQGPDSGPQYRSEIFPQTDEQAKIAKAYVAQLDAAKAFPQPIVTKTGTMKAAFYPAEAYHQDFFRRNPTHPYIVRWDKPKVAAFKAAFPALARRI